MKRVLMVVLVCCLVLASCQPDGSVSGIPFNTGNKEGLQFSGCSGKMSFYCTERDLSVVADLKKVMEECVPKISGDLQYEDTFPFSIEVYPDQSAYNAHLTDKSVAGSPACSGNRRIFLVSPASSIKLAGISYEDRLQMAAHEFAHILVDEINKAAPIWLDEGIACYESSFDFYIEAGREYMERLPKIDFEKLEKEYYSLPAADLYAFYAVSFIIDEYGFGTLNKLLRSPEELEEILGIDKSDFSSRCGSYMRDLG